MDGFAPTVTAQLNSVTGEGKSITFLLPGGGSDPVPLDQFYEESRQAAARMAALGVAPGSHVALLGPTSRELTTVIAGVWLAGATLVVLPLPMRLGSIEAFIEATRERVRKADLDLLLVSDEFVNQVQLEKNDPKPERLRFVLEGDAPEYREPEVSPEDMVVLQFTSGSTGDPKGVTVTHGAMVANLEGACIAADVRDDDRVLSWLPLYHDMGLIGALGVSLMYPLDMVLGAPQDFLARPRDWLKAVSDYRATVTAAPNSAYALAARMLERTSDDFDLSSWRIALNGAEPVDPATVERFVAAGKPFGLSEGAPFCAYGLAEATIAGTFPEPGTGMSVDTVDEDALELKGEAIPGGTYRLAKLGKPVPSVELRVVGETGEIFGDRKVGEIQLRGPAITRGYYKDPKLTASVFDGEWFKTGDLGYTVDGELVICGRIKDVIIVSGRNVYPQDIERAAEKVDGVRAGNVISFGVPGARNRESVVVVAETKTDPTKAETVAKNVATAVREHVGVPVREVVMIAPSTLPKTSSGKVQRNLCKRQFLEGELKVVADFGRHA